MQPDNVKVRFANAADASAVLKLANQLHPTVEVPGSPFREIFPALVATPGHICLVAELGTEIVGYASGYTHFAIYASGLVAYLDEIVVAIGKRGNSLGASLLESFEDWAAKQGCKLIGLATGGARAFYERHGYESRAGYYKKRLNRELA